MSRPPFYECDTRPTNIFSSGNVGTYVSATQGSDYYSVSQFVGFEEDYRIPVVETKKEKLDRISKTKMLASWKKYDDKTPTIKKINQMCKPVHRITNGAFRGLR
jgi:hypothetical protein